MGPRKAGHKENVKFQMWHGSAMGRCGLRSFQQSVGTAGAKHNGGCGWQCRFTQAAAPGHCCRLSNFNTEVCVLRYRDGSLTTNNSSSQYTSCFLNS